MANHRALWSKFLDPMISWKHAMLRQLMQENPHIWKKNRKFDVIHTARHEQNPCRASKDFSAVSAAFCKFTSGLRALFKPSYTSLTYSGPNESCSIIGSCYNIISNTLHSEMLPCFTDPYVKRRPATIKEYPTGIPSVKSFLSHSMPLFMFSTLWQRPYS